MQHYRIYCLNGEGRFSKVKDVEAASDANALQLARELRHDHPCEVWDGGRLVGKVPAKLSA